MGFLAFLWHALLFLLKAYIVFAMTASFLDIIWDEILQYYFDKDSEIRININKRLDDIVQSYLEESNDEYFLKT